jgi:hypothetical protein
MNTAIVDHGSALAPGTHSRKGATVDFVRLLALDLLPAGRRQLVCHWYRDGNGRLSCIWEPDWSPVPHR